MLSRSAEQLRVPKAAQNSRFPACQKPTAMAPAGRVQGNTTYNTLRFGVVTSGIGTCIARSRAQ